MFGLTGLSKSILIIFFLFIVYKSRLYLVVFRWGDALLVKVGILKKRYDNVQGRSIDGVKRKKFIKRMLEKSKFNDEV